jgi:hypothetical protein
MREYNTAPAFHDTMMVEESNDVKLKTRFLGQVRTFVNTSYIIENTDNQPPIT